MSAYAETYLMDAMENLGEMADYASRAFDIDIEHFWALFTATALAKEFEIGSPRVVVGMSGTELALRAGECIGLSPIESPLGSIVLADNREHESALATDYDPFGLTPEYWCGWALAYYQWASGRSFSEINEFLTMQDVLRMYPTFHEESEERFAEAAERRALQADRISHLREYRLIAGLSQSELARRSGVGIRAIQQYEQGVKDINKAAASSVRALARVLHCLPGDLLEPESSIEYAFVNV
ncbi:MAG: helix-turn-helix transcriptional regulator [Coriobacteriales bacterium]